MAAKKKSRAKKSTARKSVKRSGSTLPARYALVGVVALALLVSFPLFTVWKQVYITSSAKTMNQLADSVAVLNKEKTRLRLVVEQLGSRARIEHLARRDLNLDYPHSEKIVVLRDAPSPKQGALTSWRLFAVLKKSLGRDRG